ncbi:MAG: DUF1344 domain-containing protein [Candidatus Rokubacteria bacterium]|nr:DUF1344 domain-containing protein [Candidatus Rokubacteria bacterium]
MKWMVRMAVVGLALAVLVGAAWAGEVTGKIQKVDQEQKMFVLEDGTQLFAPEGLSLEKLSEGTKVKASYEERDGKNWATAIEVVSE